MNILVCDEKSPSKLWTIVGGHFAVMDLVQELASAIREPYETVEKELNQHGKIYHLYGKRYQKLGEDLEWILDRIEPSIDSSLRK